MSVRIGGPHGQRPTSPMRATDTTDTERALAHPAPDPSIRHGFPPDTDAPTALYRGRSRERVWPPAPCTYHHPIV
ncbi:hypothetical protein GCM10023204_22380 [Actinomycetospora succinea]